MSMLKQNMNATESINGLFSYQNLTKPFFPKPLHEKITRDGAISEMVSVVA